jgi:hypothetical protein
MFPDSLLVNLAFFAAAQCAVVGYMLTGRLARGLVLLFGSWILVDTALVSRFVFVDVGPVYQGALLAMQLWASLELLAFGIGRYRRSRPAQRQRRSEALRRGKLLYLHDDLDAAAPVFRGMLRADPWDLVACLSLGQVQLRRGRLRDAGSLFRRAGRLDLDRRYQGVLDEERRRLLRARGRGGRAAVQVRGPKNLAGDGAAASGGVAGKGGGEPAGVASAVKPAAAPRAAAAAGSASSAKRAAQARAPKPAAHVPRPAPRGHAAEDSDYGPPSTDRASSAQGPGGT